MTSITCTKCFKIKDATEEYWYKSKLTLSGFRGACRLCTSSIDKKWREANPVKCRESSHALRVLNAYNITPEEYADAMATSDVCQICGHSGNATASRKLNYDHCHITGKFRGVLCRTCNQAIGQLGDTAEALLKAYNYLKGTERHT